LFSGAGNAALGTLMRQGLSGGHPLPAPLRSDMETRFGEEFGGVQLHNDAGAAASAEAIGAKAYTVGNHIAFAEGRYSPDTANGKRLLAHELAHVIQQRRGGAAPTLDRNSPLENSANQAARSVSAGAAAVAVQGASGLGVAREVDDDEIKKKLARIWINREEIDKALSTVLSTPPDQRDTDKFKKANSILISVLIAVQRDIKDEIEKALPKSAASRDAAMLALGAARGVGLAELDIIDTLIDLPYTEQVFERPLLKKAGWSTAEVDKEIAHRNYQKFVNWMAEIGGIDPTTHAPSLSYLFTTQIDKVRDWALEDVYASVPENRTSFFTLEELAELAGIAVMQGLLAATGVEEVEAALKFINLLEAAQDLVLLTNADPKSQPSVNWLSVLNVVLSLLGLSRTRAANKIIKLVMMSGGVAPVLKPMIKLYKDWQNLAKDPERSETLKRDAKEVITALALIIKDVVLYARSRKGGATGAHELGAPVTAKPAVSKPPNKAAGKPAGAAEPRLTPPTGGTPLKSAPAAKPATPRGDVVSAGKPLAKTSKKPTAKPAAGAKPRPKPRAGTPPLTTAPVPESPPPIPKGSVSGKPSTELPKSVAPRPKPAPLSVPAAKPGAETTKTAAAKPSTPHPKGPISPKAANPPTPHKPAAPPSVPPEVKPPDAAPGPKPVERPKPAPTAQESSRFTDPNKPRRSLPGLEKKQPGELPPTDISGKGARSPSPNTQRRQMPRRRRVARSVKEYPNFAESIKKVPPKEALDFFKRYRNEYPNAVRSAIDRAIPGDAEAVENIDRLIRDAQAQRANEATGYHPSPRRTIGTDARGRPITEPQSPFLTTTKGHAPGVEGVEFERGATLGEKGEPKNLTYTGQTKTREILQIDHFDFKKRIGTEIKMPLAIKKYPRFFRRHLDKIVDQMRRQAQWVKDWGFTKYTWEMYSAEDELTAKEALKVLEDDAPELAKHIEITNIEQTTKIDPITEIE
jgi:hypothetical protein